MSGVYGTWGGLRVYGFEGSEILGLGLRSWTLNCRN